MDTKGLIQRLLFRKWRQHSRTEEGYCIIMPMPEDMPFLALLALEGLKKIETTHCRQIVIVGDGHSDDEGTLLKQTVSQFHDPRIDLVFFSPFHRWLIHHMDSPHWLTVIYGTNESRYSHAFLHDSDAFFLETNCIEKTYSYCTQGKFHATGVESRWDPFFKDIGYLIPGTWQMMYDVNWLRRYQPWMIRGRTMDTPHGINTFDTMLYPQYLDYGSGKVGVMPDPPRYAHFNGTIVTYRAWKLAHGKKVVDELFRILLLSILETVTSSRNEMRVMPSVDELSKGLTDESYSIQYGTIDCVRNFGEFRTQVQELCESSLFQGQRAEKIQSLLTPFDEHFSAYRLKSTDTIDGPVRRFRRNGLS